MGERRDLHLILIACAIWAGAAGVGLMSHQYLVVIIPIGAWLIGWHKSVALLLITALCAGGVLMAIRQRALSESFLSRYLDQKSSITMVASLRSDPVLGQPKNEGGYIKPASTTALVSGISFTIGRNTESAHLPLRLTTSEQVHWLPGSVVRCTGVVYSTAEKRVAALFAVRGQCVLIHGASSIGRLAGAIRSDFRIASRRVGGDSGALIPGLVLGDTSLERHEFTQEMLSAGLTHLTAVSGENFAIIAAFMMWFLQWFIRQLRLRLIINAAVLIGFIFLVRPSPSVLRATVMVAVMLIAQFRGSKSSVLPALGLAIALLIFLDPFEATDPGFALSVAATAGILLGQKPVARFLNRFIGSQKLCELLAIPLAANLLCVPVTIALSGQFSVMSIPSNIFVEPAIAPITVIGFIAALITPVLPTVGYLLALSQKYFSGWICLIAHVSSLVPVIALPRGWAGAGVGISAIAIGLLLLHGASALRLR